jgi:hypothetical protein
MSTLTIQSTTVSEMLAGAGISVIVIVGLIHLIDAPGDLQEAPYQVICSWPPSSGRSWRRSESTADIAPIP